MPTAQYHGPSILQVLGVWSYLATTWCHFASVGASLDVHVSSAQCRNTLLKKNEDPFFQKQTSAGKVRLGLFTPTLPVSEGIEIRSGGQCWGRVVRASDQFPGG